MGRLEVGTSYSCAGHGLKQQTEPDWGEPEVRLTIYTKFNLIKSNSGLPRLEINYKCVCLIKSRRQEQDHWTCPWMCKPMNREFVKVF